MSYMLKCKNVGCRNIFRWPMQLYRQTQTCKKPEKNTRKSSSLDAD